MNKKVLTFGNIDIEKRKFQENNEKVKPLSIMLPKMSR